jgi:ParB/RepB/Spo0J family partition protein
MAEANKTALSESTEQPAHEAHGKIPPASDEPVVANINAAEIPPWESIQPETPAVSAPGIADGDAIVPSKVIDGIFDGKRAAGKEAENPPAEKEAARGKNNGKEKSPKDPIRDDRPGGKAKTEKKPEAEKQKRGGRPPNGTKKDKTAPSVGGISGNNALKAEPAPATPEPPAPPRDATRPGETETIVYLTHAELFPFKGHPFGVRDDDAMKSLVESVKDRGIDQPALVRPREGGGYELVSGHRRQHAAELAGYANVPCVIRNMTDDEAVLAMTESNFNQRAEILAGERAKALKMQLEAIKHQGSKTGDLKNGELGKRSNEVVAERNKMSIKNVQRYIALNNLVPDLMQMVDDKKMKFTTAVDLSYIKHKQQKYIAVAIEAQQSAPSGAQAQRMRELDQKGVLNGDVIDGIMLEEKKEETRVILNSQELGKYFGPEQSPREM